MSERLKHARSLAEQINHALTKDDALKVHAELLLTLMHAVLNGDENTVAIAVLAEATRAQIVLRQK